MIRRIHYIFAFLLCLTVLICLVPAAYADGLSDLQAAIGRGDETFTLSTDTLIPANMEIDTGDTELIVPADTTLTVRGTLRTPYIEIRQGGAVYVDGGHLDCPWGLTPNGTLSIRDDWVDTSLFSKDVILDAVQARSISYSGNAGITLHWFVTDAEYLLQALDMAAEAMSVHDHTHTRASIELDGEMQIDTDGAALSVADGVTFQLNGVQPDNGRRELSIGDLNIQSGGSVVIEDNALLEVKGHLTLNGQLTIGEGSELYITDQDEALVSSSNIILQGDFSHIVVHYYPDDESEVYPMFVNAENLPGYAHGNVHVLFDWKPTYSISSGKTDFHFHAPVTTIPGSSFSLDNLYVDGPLTVAGTLSVGNLHAWSGSELVFTGTSRVTVSESFDLQGTLWVPDTMNLSDLCLDPGKLAVLSQYNEGYLYVSKDAGSELRDAFLAACDQGYAEPATFVIPEGNIINLLNTSVIIPGNLTVFAIGSGIRLIGESFGVGGELICSNFIMSDDSSLWIGEGGSMYVERNFQLGSNCHLDLEGELSVEHDAFDPSELVWNENFFPGENSLLDVSFNMPNEQAVLAELGAPVQPFGNFRRSIWVHFPWELTDDVTVPAQVRLCVPHDGNYQGSLTIPEGRTLTINEGGEMLARGSVNGEAVIQVNGSLVNDGSINLGDPGREADIALGPNGRYSGSGSITRGGAPYYMSDDDAWNALVAACEQTYTKMTNFDIGGEYSFVIPAGEGLFIPENLSVRALNSSFVVSDTASLIIRGGGELIAGMLDSQGSTEVDGSLHLEYSCLIPGDPVVVNGEIVMTLDAWVGLMESVDSFDPEDAAAKFSFGSDGLLDIWYDMTDSQDVADSLDFPMFHIPHVRETLCLTFPWTLDDDRTLDEDRRLLLHCGGEYNGMLIIPEGKTLMIPQGSELFARGAGVNGEAIVKIAGLLINNGVFTLQYTRAGLADAELIDGGIYAGRGTVTRGGEPYTILNDPENAQIVLPADLRMLESEALAGGDFFSVYIPAGTESIADDAFGNKDALMVFGVPDSEADIFAGDHHYLFAPTA